MRFYDALQSLDKRKLVRRDSWTADVCIVQSDGAYWRGVTVPTPKADEAWLPTAADLLAADWSEIANFKAMDRIKAGP